MSFARTLNKNITISFVLVMILLFSGAGLYFTSRSFAATAPPQLWVWATARDAIGLRWTANDVPIINNAHNDVYVDGAFYISLPSSMTSYPAGASCGASHSFQVVLVDGAARYPSNVVEGTTDPCNLAPTAPSNLTVTPLSSKQTKLSWDPSTDDSGSQGLSYQVYRNGIKIDSQYASTYCPSSVTCTFTDSGLKPATQYSYYVTAWDTYTYSPNSPTITVKTLSDLLGDTNADNRVNALDLSLLISHDGQNYPAADFNKDGTVGSADLAILIAKWTW